VLKFDDGEARKQKERVKISEIKEETNCRGQTRVNGPESVIPRGTNAARSMNEEPGASSRKRV